MRFLGPEGRTIVLEVQAVPFDDGGKPAILAVGRDITERKSTEERQAFLMAELDHRVRNSLASIQSMALLTGRTAATKEEYAEKLQGRIAAMARAHGLLTREHWDGADLADIVHDALQAFGEAVVIEGRPECPLRARDALNLALVLHELATNAAKYGALSAAGRQGRRCGGISRARATNAACTFSGASAADRRCRRPRARASGRG